MVVNLLYNAYHMVMFLKNVFSAFIMRFFWQKNPENLERWKNRKYDEEKLFYFEEKTF